MKISQKLKGFLSFIINELKNKSNIIIFICVLIVAYAPTWLSALLAIIFKNEYLWGVAVAYAAFWAAPFTPFFPLVIAITLAIRKIYDKLKRH